MPPSQIGVTVATPRTVTINNSGNNVGVITLAAHGLHQGNKISLQTTGGLPTGLSVGTLGADTGTVYYAEQTSTSGSFSVSAQASPTLLTSISVAAPGVVTLAGHGLVGGEAIMLYNFDGTYPTGLAANTVYYVKYIDANTFNLSATYAGGNITTTGTSTGQFSYKLLIKTSSAGSGTQTITNLNNVELSITSGSPQVFWSGSSTVTIQTGMVVTGYGIPAGTAIKSIYPNSNTGAGGFTLSANATQTVHDAGLVFTPADTTSVPATPVAGPCCDTANTSILTTYTVAGWTLYDGNANAGGADTVVLRSPLVDDATQFKYMSINITATNINIVLYESWNNGTHVGTNQSTALASTSQQQVTFTVAASMIINASARHCLIQSTIAAGIGAVGSTYSGSTYNNFWTSVFERSRLAPWDTVAAGYPCSCLLTGANFSNGTTYPTTAGVVGPSTPRIKNPAGGDFTGSAAGAGNAQSYIGLATMGWFTAAVTNQPGGVAYVAGYTGAVVTKVPDGAGGFYTPLTAFNIVGSAAAWPGGSISSICDVWLGPAYPQNLDEITYSGKTYVFLQNTNLFATVTANLAVPKG